MIFDDVDGVHVDAHDDDEIASGLTQTTVAYILEANQNDDHDDGSQIAYYFLSGVIKSKIVGSQISKDPTIP